jgi:outer membrane protein TolC
MVSAVCLVFSGGVVSPARAQGPSLLELDWEGLLARAQNAPAVELARAAISEARARRIAASPPLPANPMLDATGGPRWQGDGIIPQLEVGIVQSFHLADVRGGLIGAADAAIEGAIARANDVARQVLAEAVEAWLRALEAEAHLALAREHARVAEQIVRVAEQRVLQGDASVVELHLAQIGLARARAGEAERAAELSEHLGTLRSILGIPPRTQVVLRGQLGAIPSPERAAVLDALRERGDLRALRSEVREAVAQRRAGEAARWPQLTAGVGYAMDQGNHLLLTRLGVSLPLFDDGAGARAIAEARAARATSAAEILERTLVAEVNAAFEAIAFRARAVEVLAEALPEADAEESLARRAFEAGEMALLDLLRVRGETLAIRREYLAQLGELDRARARLAVTAGVLR